ncbi:LytTR family transcriptional regulator DNA-binding domain-containing protein [Neptunicella marina]|uniref:LytTR family transcriptional regulator DNA-binding domain-containing protein n=2 Tax=Neptunicella marina TaxID=2125989 RepID=A0A8J6J0S3_9ALTE|nr:LytTR family DNA-binding domain-containing protein [Neptunicella marina]MBC3767658.1 LytTR family transcriptional regulator DNA-binding domain-containing protein [Neptunicella marina]
MTLFERYDKNKTLWLTLLFALYLLIPNTINALSVWTEHNRNGAPDIALWEPFTWEYTSALAVLLLIPVVLYWFKFVPPKFTGIGKQIVLHIGASIVFSLAHVLLMVWFRDLVYQWHGWEYQFGNFWSEFVYEYRKDVLGYLNFFVMLQIYHFIYSRLKGEANLISNELSENDVTPSSNIKVPEHLLVKKLDKEFLVKVSDIEWMESAGNYVNLHSGGRIYPLRATLANTIEKLQTAGFSRIHRSYAVKHLAIDNISYAPSGDGEITLKSGHKLTLSRRYKDAFKQQFS